MRQHIAAAIAALALVAVATAPSDPASAADAKSEALALINDLRTELESIAETAEGAATRIAGLSVSGSSTKNKAVAEAEVKALAVDIAALDTKLRALDAKVTSLSATKTTTSSSGSSSSGSSSSSSSSGSSSSGFRVTCDVSDRTVGVGDSVTYTATVTGGSKPYTYSWTGVFLGNGSSQKASFLDPGTYREKITVTDKAKKTASDDCPKVEVDDTFSDGVDDDAGDRAKNPKVSLIEPASNAKLTAGTSATIRWKATGLASSDRLDIYLEDATSENVYYVATSIEKGNDGKGTYTWPSAGTVASAFLPYGQYTLRVCTTDGEVCAAGKVTIVKPAS